MAASNKTAPSPSPSLSCQALGRSRSSFGAPWGLSGEVGRQAAPLTVTQATERCQGLGNKVLWELGATSYSFQVGAGELRGRT